MGDRWNNLLSKRLQNDRNVMIITTEVDVISIKRNEIISATVACKTYNKCNGIKIFYIEERDFVF